MNDEISSDLKIHSAANAAAPTARAARRRSIRRIDLQIYPLCFFKCPARSNSRSILLKPIRYDVPHHSKARRRQASDPEGPHAGLLDLANSPPEPPGGEPIWPA